MLEVKNVSYSYEDGASRRLILKDIDVSFKSGTFYTITGENGSGKTTLLSLLGALDRPQTGDILFNGQSIYDDPSAYLSKHVGFVFQSYNLIDYMTAYENVKASLNIAKVNKNPENIYGLLNVLGIGKDKADRLVSKLSGGEMQRVAIARAIAKNPSILLSDEPTGNLDEQNSRFVCEMFKILAHKLDLCVIMVTHDLNLAKESDVIYRIYLGDKRLIHETL